jgi:AmmeMemoRadiSam system protein A
MPELLTIEERNTLLHLARQALEECVHGRSLAIMDLSTVSPTLREAGASFVTLTINDKLRGCIGTLEAYQPLVEDVRQHAVDAALHDYRFPRVQPGELKSINIEVSRLTAPVPLEYADAKDLLNRLRRGVDGVILHEGFRKATFLPQVWEKLPDPATFLDHLCEKMGVSADTWRHKHLQVATYQVEEFHE